MTIVHSLLSVALLLALADADQYRLPNTVLPTYYTIRLAPNIESGRFNGESEISIAISANDTKTVTLHAKNLAFNESFTTLIDEKNNNVRPMKQTIDNVTDFLTLDFSKHPLAAGNYALNFQYTGQINDEPIGFYRSSYINKLGKETWLAATRFTPTHARRAFPCFDEPAMKAKFKIAIDHSYKHSVISNTPVHNTTEDDKHYPNLRTTFKVTPVMSTYAIAFVISEFKSATNDDETVSVWSRQSQIYRSDYALSIGESLLELFEEYTAFDHAIPKMDNVAIPQLHTDSVDNWGLATYRENELLRDDVSTARNKQDIAMAIAREFAHEWFGDLVSPMWWDSTWLNEGFANYLQYYMLNEVEPSWRMMDQFVVKNLQEKAFSADDTNVVQRPLNSMVNSPAEISKNFDDITSSKAACIIRMFSHALGAEVFRTGLKAYLKKYAYGAATSYDLLNELVSAEGAPSGAKGSFERWINQKGYPLVTVVRHTNTNWMLRQTRYLSNGKSDRASNEVWSIPVTYTKQINPNFNHTAPSIWLHQSQSDWLGYTNGWIILNIQQTGYYRVMYQASDWNSISDYLNTKDYQTIHVLNRAQLLDDSFQLAQDKYLGSYNFFLRISRYLQQEADSIPWYPAFRAFSYLNRALWNTEHHDLFKFYMLRIMEKLETGIVYDPKKADRDHVTKLNNIKVIKWACEMGSVNCTTAANKMFTQYLDGSSKIPSDLRRVVLCTAIRTGNSTIWNQTFRLYGQTNDENERSDILGALGCSADVKILKSYLMKAINPASKISFEFVLKKIVDTSKRGIDVATDFMKKKFVTIMESVGDEETVLRCANYIGSRIFTKDQREKYERFVNSLLADNKDLANAVTANGLARAITNVKWMDLHEQDFSSFLRDQKLVDNQ